MSGATHIAGLVVRARPEHADTVAARIAARPRHEVHAVADGKIIVVVEAESERALADRMDELRAQAEVLFVNLAYHQMDTDPADTGPESA